MVQAWKCYMCNLHFGDEAHARMHKVMMNHPATKIRLAVVQRVGFEPTNP